MAPQAVIPVGPIPKDVLEDYFEIINRYRHVSLSATRSFYREQAQKTPFPYMDWSSSYMHFRFLPVRGQAWGRKGLR